MLWSQLSVGGGQRLQFGAEDALGCAGFVDRDVRPRATHHGVGRPQHRGERHHVCSGAIPHQIARGVCPEQIAEASLALSGPLVGAVGESVPVVGGEQGFHHQRVSAGSVVAGEGA